MGESAPTDAGLAPLDSPGIEGADVPPDVGFTPVDSLGIGRAEVPPYNDTVASGMSALLSATAVLVGTVGGGSDGGGVEEMVMRSS